MTTPKTHPRDRELGADDPLELRGFDLQGDRELMLRVLVEEYARMGFGLEELMRLTRSPFYVAFHRIYLCHGEDGMRGRIAAVLARCGVARVREAASDANRGPRNA